MLVRCIVIYRKNIHLVIQITKIPLQFLAHSPRNPWNFLKDKNNGGDFPGGPVDKNPPANTGDTGLIPGPGRLDLLQSN